MPFNHVDILENLMENTEKIYERVEGRLNILRVGQLCPFWLAKNLGDKPFDGIDISFSNPARAFEETARLYHEMLCADADVNFEIWVVKDPSDDYAPPIIGLYAGRGFASLLLRR